MAGGVHHLGHLRATKVRTWLPLAADGKHACRFARGLDHVLDRRRHPVALRPDAPPVVAGSGPPAERLPEREELRAIEERRLPRVHGPPGALEARGAGLDAHAEIATGPSVVALATLRTQRSGELDVAGTAAMDAGEDRLDVGHACTSNQGTKLHGSRGHQSLHVDEVHGNSRRKSPHGVSGAELGRRPVRRGQRDAERHEPRRDPRPPLRRPGDPGGAFTGDPAVDGCPTKPPNEPMAADCMTVRPLRRWLHSFPDVRWTCVTEFQSDTVTRSVEVSIPRATTPSGTRTELAALRDDVVHLAMALPFPANPTRTPARRARHVVNVRPAAADAVLQSTYLRSVENGPLWAGWSKSQRSGRRSRRRPRHPRCWPGSTDVVSDASKAFRTRWPSTSTPATRWRARPEGL